MPVGQTLNQNSLDEKPIKEEEVEDSADQPQN